jgi:hypothetical protein
MTFEEREAEMHAKLDAILGPMPMPKPKLVVDDGEVVADVYVPVHPKDHRNSHYGRREVVEVSKPDPEWLTAELPFERGRFDRVTIDMALAEVQQQDRARDRARLAPPDRMADPMNIWGGRRDD